MNRPEINHALAKAIAYTERGNPAMAELWVARLAGLLACATIVNPARVGLVKTAIDASREAA